MREWIVGLTKAATQKGDGLEPMQWFRLEGGVNAVPDELRDLYEKMNGATLPPKVTLFPFFSQGETKGAVERSLEAPGWTFGTSNKDLLFTARKRDLTSFELPDWAQFLRDDEWLYAAQETSGKLRCYRSLEQMLSRLVPPAQTEEFGEVTYANALSAVEGALGSLAGDWTLEAANESSVPAKSKPRKSTKKAPAKKASKSKLPPKKKPAKKAAAKVAKKPAKKPVKKAAKKTVKKPVKKTAKKAVKKAKKKR